MESIAALTNLLYREVKSHPEGKPNEETLDAIFQEYEERQIPRTQKIMNFTNVITRVQAWDGFWMKLMKLGRDLGDIIRVGSSWISCQFESLKRSMSCGTMRSNRGEVPLGIRCGIS